MDCVYSRSQVDVLVVCTVTSIRAGYSGLNVGCLSTVVSLVVGSGADGSGAGGSGADGSGPDAMREVRLVLL